MKKILAIILTLSLLLGMLVTVTVPVVAATVSIVSGTDTKIVGVYNKAGGGSTFVDLSSSPLNAVRAQEPKPYPTGYVSEPLEVTNSVWDNGVNWSFQTNAPAADWIWETERAEGPASYPTDDPLYDAAAYKWGRVVVFEQTFNIAGIPQGGQLYITADNAWEVWINDVSLARSLTAKVANWWETDLKEAKVATTGWQKVGQIAVPASMLVYGENTITIMAANEYFAADDGNSPDPALNVSPYYQYNPGAMIFSLDVTYDEVTIDDLGIDIEKLTNGNDVDAPTGPIILVGDPVTWTYTITNTGSFALTDIVVTDDQGVIPLYKSGDVGDDGVLSPGEVWVYEATGIAVAGQYSNIGTATGWFNDLNVSDTDTSWYYGLTRHDETAWAKGDDATSNNEVSGSSAWGWTNAIGTKDGEWTMALWAAAGQNETSNGILVGTVTVTRVGDTVEVTYEIDTSLDEEYTIIEAHLWVGDTELPIVVKGKNSTATAAPGQFPFSPSISSDGLTANWTGTFSESTELWVAAHAVIEWWE